MLMQYLIRQIAAAALMLHLVACGSGGEDTRTVAEVAPDDSAWMADTLQKIVAALDPMQCYAMNSERAMILQRQAEAATGTSERATLMFRQAEALLNAGRTEDAIFGFQGLIRAFAGENPQISNQTKRLFERLALAYLRLGEQQNCQQQHSVESCVLPIRGDGIHTLPQGSQQAAALYRQILKKYPNDLQSRWLLNIAHMTLGDWPEAVPPPFRLPEAVLGPNVEDFPEFAEIAMPNGVAVDGTSGGVVVADFDGDRRLDILCSGYGFEEPLRLFVGQAEGGFREKPQAFPPGILSGLNLVQADYDNDGDQDVFILRGGWFAEAGNLPNSLLQNQGNGTFRDVTRSAGLFSAHPTQTAAWCDVNVDGWLDLVIGNEAAPSELYLSQKDGTFAEIGPAAGLPRDAFVKSVAAGDYNRDGFPDLFLSVLGGPNWLLQNESRDGTVSFRNVAANAGVQAPFFAFPAWFWDYDQDGWQDIYVGSYDLRNFNQLAREVCAQYTGDSVQAERPRLYRNLGNGRFEEVSATAGLDRLAYAMGSSHGDLDNNGFPDVFLGTGAPDFSTLIPNQVYRNQGGHFLDVSRAGRFGHLQKGHGTAFADFDGDGQQEVYMVLGGAYEGDRYPNVLYHHEGNDAHWLRLTLQGKQANRSALGAEVVVTVLLPDGSERRHYGQVSPGSSFGGNDLSVHLGLGKAVSIRELRVRWPVFPAKERKFTGVPMDQHLLIVEDAESWSRYEAKPVGWATSGPAMDHSTHTP